jgi:hypothetical protein
MWTTGLTSVDSVYVVLGDIFRDKAVITGTQVLSDAVRKCPFHLLVDTKIGDISTIMVTPALQVLAR